MPRLPRLGIIGAENSHSWAIAEVCNTHQKAPLRVTHLWGETQGAAQLSAKRGNIPQIASDWREMAGSVDGVMIDHRNGADHTEPARFFLERGIPTFVDKPISLTLRDAKSLFALAERTGAPLATYGIVPLQRRFRAYANALRASSHPLRFLNSTGPADIAGPHGGIFYYGFHQVDAAVELMGTEVRSVSLQRSGEDGIAALLYRGGHSAVLRFLKAGGFGFHFQACHGSALKSLEARFDTSPYLAAAQVLARFLSTGQPPQRKDRMLAPIAVLEALNKSLQTGRLQKVADF